METGTRTVRLNGERRSIRATTVAELLRELGYLAERGGLAVALNGGVVPRSEWATALLRGEDEVDVVTAVQGG